MTVHTLLLLRWLQRAGSDGKDHRLCIVSSPGLISIGSSDLLNLIGNLQRKHDSVPLTASDQVKTWIM